MLMRMNHDHPLSLVPTCPRASKEPRPSLGTYGIMTHEFAARFACGGRLGKCQNLNFEPATEKADGQNLLGFLRLRPRPFCS